MKKYYLLLLILCSIPGKNIRAQTPFAPGNIVVLRLGDGAVYSVTAPLFLDEYTPTGSLVQSIALPATDNGSNFKITSSISRGDQCFLALSSNRQFLTLVGFAVDPNTSQSSLGATANRVIARIDYNGSINTSTRILGADIGNTAPPRSAITDDGTRFWVTHQTGIRYVTLGQSSSTVIASGGGNSYSTLSVYGGQLYCNWNGMIPYTVSGGLPISGPQTLTAFPGIPLGIGQTSQIYLADLNSSIPGFDVMYLTENSTYALSKFSFDPGTGNWILNGTIGTDLDLYRGITGVVNGTSVTLYCTKDIVTSGTSPGKLVTFTDNTGYTLAANSFTGTPTTIATPGTNQAFRGVSMVPVKCSKPNILLSNLNPTGVDINWSSVVAGASFEYVISNSATPPASGTTTNATNYNATGLTPGLHYYVHVRSNCGGGDYSQWSTVAFTTTWPPCLAPLILPPIYNSNNTVTINWNPTLSGIKYEYAVTSSSVSPAAGSFTTATTYNVSGVTSATQYYFHIRAYCGGGDTSAWTSKSFTTNCFKPFPYLITNNSTAGTADVGWNKLPGVAKYEYAVLNTIVHPSGVLSVTADSVLHLAGLTPGNHYYLHVRSRCDKGQVSDWNVLEFQVSGVGVYPNPSHDLINIRLTGQPGTANPVIIYDDKGRIMKKVILTGNTATVDIRSWAAGIYYVRYGNDKSYVTTILKW